MKIKITRLLYLITIIVILNSCAKNEFEVVSVENTLIKNNEILSLDVTKQVIEQLYCERYPNDFWHYGYRGDKELQNIKTELLAEKPKGIITKISIKNNSNQIIENSTLTVLIKFTFENEKVFNYIKPNDLLSESKVWKKNQNLNLNLYNVINYSSGYRADIFKIHTPKNVTIECYITAKNSIGYNNIGNLKKTEDLFHKERFNNGIATYFEEIPFYEGGPERGVFASRTLAENEMLGFGSKILSEDITDIWSGNIENKTKTETVEKPKNGDLNNSFINQQKLKQEKERKYKQEKDKLLSEGWKDEEIQNGQLSTCYNFKPAKGKVKNHLEVIVGGGTDVSIKVMNVETEKCIRYVFINSGTTFNIDNIPEGKYYLKIAYGKDWLSKIKNGQCVGKFVKNPLYEKGEDILDFNIQRNSNGRSIPSYKLSLDVVSSGISNSFNSQNISENDFNK